ncbi:MAG: hypothetical protein IPG07_19110 [Crocinitomicaceae bacterium]|nr:hypothetical protein [Crocinitomicaceae bacterium]
MLQEALARADYRGAVRIYFIFIVRDLSQKNWINWEKENHLITCEMCQEANTMISTTQSVILKLSGIKT